MEYLLELRYRDGDTGTVPDPGNPQQVQGAFGPKSVLEFPGYAPPDWLAAPAEPGRCTAFDVPGGSLGAAISVRTWAPADARDDEVLPLLVVHDGPEYDALAQLTGYLSAGVTGGWLPRLRAALLSPGPRDRWYSADAGYALALTREVRPRPEPPAADQRADRDGYQPRRAGRAARSLPLPGRVRRPVPAVRQFLLPAFR